MRWHLQASGDAPEGTHQDLAGRLRDLLAEAGFGTDASHFSGDQVEGPVHDAPPDQPAADEPAAGYGDDPAGSGDAA